MAFLCFAVDLMERIWFNNNNAENGCCQEKGTATDNKRTGGKKLKKKILSVLLSASMILTMSGMTVLAGSTGASGAEALAEKAAEANVLQLWYDEPVSKGTTILSAGSFGTTAEDNQWQQLSLPIGNSYMGANVYGEIGTERLTFNQKTLWNGGPSESRPDYNGGNKTTASNGKLMTEAYKDVVDALLKGESTASNLCNYLIGDSNGYGAYQSWGDIYLTFEGLSDDTRTTDYVRSLDLAEGIANVDFTADGTTYHREYFISYPDNVLAMKLTAQGGSKLNFNVSFPVDNAENVLSKKLGKDVTYTVDAGAGTIVTAGSMQDNQMKMNSMLQVVTTGTVAANADGSSLDISGADEAVIFVAADTDYENTYPSYRTGETDAELAASVAEVAAAAKAKGYDAVKEDHLTDYKGLFDRLNLDLGQSASDKTTDELLAAYKAGSATEAERRLLEVLLYQYGRYLTIASSREGDLPSNLQGVWQNRAGDANRVPWGSDYHMNVNLQMNYWPTYSANLAECAVPLIDYVDSLREPGRVTAAAYYGITSAEGEENGFTAHTQNTPFGWTCPGWDFSWGWSPAAVPWILQNCWEYYEYTGDVDFMRERIYPMLREEAVLYDKLLVDSGVEITMEDGTKSTRLVSAPTYSPEHGPRTLGNAYEQELIWQLYEDVITAAETLGVDEDKVAEWKETQSRLAPIEVGDSGQIKEWYTETTLGSIGERGHRHMSHLLGLFPGDLISVDNDEYMDAAIVSLTDRGMTSTGWGMGQRINAWARTGQGNTAYQLIKNLFQGGIYPNLWDSHAPFQIDGNFGYTSGVNEMLMQSNMGYINLLPALPDDWAEGHVDGLVARGNFELDMNWSGGQLDGVTLLSKNGGEAVVQYENIFLASVTDESGKEIEIKKVSDDRISFATEKGKSYQIREIPASEKISTPSGLRVEREEDQAVLSWNAVETEGVTYNVYRRIGEGELVKLADGVTGTQYTDQKSYQVLGELTYQVSASLGSAESGLSEGVSLTNYEMVDDRDARVSYSGAWGDWDEDTNYNGTIKYLQSPEGGETATLSFDGTGIAVLTCLNHDRGKLEITIDEKSYGEVDTYNSSTTRQYEVFTAKNLTPGTHSIVVKATNTKSDASSGTKVELDGFKIWSGSGMPKLPDGEKGQTLAAETGRVMIQWEAEAGADSYNIYNAAGTKVAQADTSCAWIEGLDAGKEYTFTIKAVIEGAEASKSLEIKTETLAKAAEQGEEKAPEKVSELQALKAENDEQAKLTWKASEGAAKYEIWIAGKRAATTADTSYVLTGLTKGQKYTVKIVAVSAQGKKSAAAGVTFTAGSLKDPAHEEIPDTKPDLKPDIKPEPTPAPGLKDGDTFQNGNFVYRVTSASAQKVEVVKLQNSKLAKLKIANTVKENGKTYKVVGIAASAYKGNKKISTVTIGKNVESIGANAFAGCTKLTKVTVSGNSLKKIGAKAFSGCKKLKSILIKSKVLKSVGKNAFKNIHAKAVIKVPKAKYKTYAKLLAKKGQKKTVKIRK